MRYTFLASYQISNVLGMALRKKSNYFLSHEGLYLILIKKDIIPLTLQVQVSNATLASFDVKHK
jgi:hypothetical protein